MVVAKVIAKALTLPENRVLKSTKKLNYFSKVWLFLVYGKMMMALESKKFGHFKSSTNIDILATFQKKIANPC